MSTWYSAGDLRIDLMRLGDTWSRQANCLWLIRLARVAASTLNASCGQCSLESIGIGHKAHMDACDKETKEEKQDLIYGKFEHAIDTTSKVAGLTRRQYEECQIGKIRLGSASTR